MTEIEGLVVELSDRIQWQRMPVEMDDVEYEEMLTDMIMAGIRRMLIQTGRFAVYKNGFVIYDDDGKPVGLDYEMPIDEREYIILDAEISFFNKLAGSVNTMTSYTTDALSVTGGDKPFRNIADTLASLREEQRKVFYTMVRHTII